jgi:DNA-binding transcriptional regulator LsrR (DeoR family)
VFCGISGSTGSGKLTDDWPEQLAVRIAHCYYNLGMTQQQIATELGIGRARVIRLLNEARKRGLVSVQINSPLLENIELAEQITERWSLLSAEVCLSHASEENQLATQIGAAAGNAILPLLHSNMTVGLGWGISLKEMVAQLKPFPLKNVSVISLLGSLTRRSSIAKFEATTAFAARLNAECLYLPAPLICDSKKTRELLMTQPMFQDIHQRALNSDIAIVSIGGLDSSTIRDVELVSEEEYQSVTKKGAIGNFLGYFIDSNARVVKHPVNNRVIGVSGEVFACIPRRVMVSGGDSKVKALKAVLDKGLITDIVTDVATAKRLLAES